MRRVLLPLIATALAGACVHATRPLVAPPTAIGTPAPLDGALPFSMVLDSSLAANDPALSARLRALDAAGDHDGVFTRGDAWAAGEPQVFADLHIHPFMSYALRPFFRGTPDAKHATSSPTAILHTQVTLPLLQRGATNVLFAGVYVGMVEMTGRARFAEAMRQIDYAKRFAASHPDRMEIALSAADVRRIVAAKKIAVVLCIEGAHVLREPSDVDLFYDAGVRMMTLVHFTDTAVGGAAFSTLRHPENFHWFGRHEKKDGTTINRNGLGTFGRETVTRMIARGMIIDLAHASDRTTRDVLDLTKDRPVPMLISHTALRSYHAMERNSPDDLIAEVARRGGVIGLSTWRVELVAKGIPECHAFTTHFKHLLEIAGRDHVGLGTDFNGGVMRPRPCKGPSAIDRTGVRNVGDLPELFQSMVDDGIAPRDVEAMGSNVLRVMDAVETRAAE